MSRPVRQPERRPAARPAGGAPIALQDVSGHLAAASPPSRQPGVQGGAPAPSAPVRRRAALPAPPVADGSSRRLAALLATIETYDEDKAVDLSNRGIEAPSDRAAVMLALAEHAPLSCFESRALLSTLDEPARLAIATALTETRPGLLGTFIQDFRITDPARRMRLFIDNFADGPMEALAALAGASGARADDALARETRRVAALEACELTARFFGNDPRLPDFTRHAEALDIPHPWVATLMDEARSEPDDYLAADLCRWTHDLNAQLHDVKIAPALQRDAELTAHGILQCRMPAVRSRLTDLLVTELVRRPAVPAASFRAVCTRLQKTHARPFRPAVAGLVRHRHVDAADVPALCDFISHAALKNATTGQGALQGLLALEAAGSLTPDRCRRLLGRLVPRALGKAPVRDAAAALRDVAGLLPLADQPGLRSDVAAVVDRIHALADVPAALASLLFRVLDRDAAAPDPAARARFTDRLARYNARLAGPSPLMAYSARLVCGVSDPAERAALVAVLNRFVDAVVLSDDPAAFLHARNDPARSPHLRHAAAVDPAAFDGWCHLERRIPLPSAPDSGWHLDFNQSADGYLRCGSVTGSCQDPHGNVDDNKALMGYVMQGRIRMVALTSPAGVLHARRMLRLAIDPVAGRLVIMLEPTYANAGGPEDVDGCLREFARTIARELGCPLVTHVAMVDGRPAEDPARIGSALAPYPRPLHLYPDAAVWEYIDSEHLVVHDCRQELVFTKARQVD